MKKSIGAPPGTLFVPRANEQYEDAEVYIIQLRKMVEELQTEKNEYYKYRCHLKENARAVYKANILLEKAIREHWAYYLELLALLNQKPNIILYTNYYYEKYAHLPDGVHDLNDINEKIREYQNDILEIEDEVEKLMKQLSEFAFKMHFYRIIITLIYRLIKINILFIKEIKNCLSYNYKTEMLKEKLGRKDELEIDKSKLKETANQIDNYSQQLYQCLPLYDQVQQAKQKNQKSNEDSESGDDFDEWLGIEKIESQMIVFPKSQSYFEYEENLKEIDQDVTIDEEKAELKRIVNFDGYDYLHNPDMLEYLRRLKLAFGLIRSPRKDRSNNNNNSKKNQKICKVHNSPKVTKIQRPDIDPTKKVNKSKDDEDKNNRVITAPPPIITDVFSNLSDSENSIGPLKFGNPYASRKFGEPLHFTYPFEFKSWTRGPFNIEEEDESYEEFTLYIPRCDKKEKVELVDVETCTNNNEFLVQPPKSKKASSPRRQFKYDPSIFYTPILPQTTRGRLKLDQTDPVRLKVTLKDIGLEGLDSATPDRTQQLWYSHSRKSERGEKKQSPKRRFFMKKY